MQDFLFRQRHPLKLFEVDEQKYVADLVTGQVIPVDHIIWELLKVTSEDNENSIETFRQKYPDFQFDKAIAKLKNLRARGVLFSYEKETEVPQKTVTHPKEKPQLFLSGDFLVRRRQHTFLTNFNHYCLLKALAKKADIYIPISSQEEKEEMFDFGEIGIHPLEVERTGGQSPLKWMGTDCDGILLLNPQIGELFCFESELPVIVRWEESRQSKREMIEFAVSSVGLATEKDALCFTSSWTKKFFSSLLPRDEYFYTLVSGLSLNPLEAPDKQHAKKIVAQYIENEQFTNKPIIGIIPGMDLQKTAPFLLELAQRNPDLAFLVLSLTPYLSATLSSNIATFSIQSFEDYQVCTIIFSALDLLCFPTALGTPPSLVFEAINCGVTPVVIGGEQLPEELEDIGVLIPSAIDQFSNLTIPIEQLEKVIKGEITDSVKRDKSGVRKAKASLVFSWDKTADELLKLLRNLWRKKDTASQTQSISLPFVFTYYYDKSSDSVSHAAFDLEERTYRPFLNFLLHSLEQRHRSPEIEQILKALEKERAKEEKV